MPPVATTVTLVPSSASIRSRRPSSMAAAPSMMPLRMESRVFLPMAQRGSSRLMPGSWAVLPVRASMEIFTPGQMQPPTKAPLSSMAVMVVAVPMSTSSSGAPYSAMAATAATIRSLPTSDGLSMRMLRPVLMPGPTTRALQPVSLRMAVLKELSTGGTTEEMMLPSMSSGETSKRLSMVFNSAQYWSEVLMRSVAIRASKRILSSSMQPRTMLVLPISTAMIIGIPPWFDRKFCGFPW